MTLSLARKVDKTEAMGKRIGTPVGWEPLFPAKEESSGENIIKDIL
jgi:hypothetical protein